MMILKLPLNFTGSKGEEKLYALFDTGSTFSCISADYAEKIGSLIRLEEPMLFSTASESQFLQVEYIVSLKVEINDLVLDDEFIVVSGLSEDAIIGVSSMQKWKVKLDFEYDTLIVESKIAKLIAYS